ncbi:MAG: hypothetical protein HOV68_31915 [Streptomycetaceae bacterium]|nr:hypothetical protein [Streptomycetaceae bacterium]
MRSTRLTLIGTAAALALALTACGSDDKDDKADDAKSSGAASAPSSSSASPSGKSSPDADATATATNKPKAEPVDPAKFPLSKPGTQLKIGQPAVVSFEDGDDKGNLQVTVTAIEKGSIEDLTAAGIKIEDKDKTSTPYYVRADFKNVSAADLSNSNPTVKFSALDAAGRDLGFTMLMGSFDKCDSPDTDEFTSGAQASGCELYLAPAGATVASVTFDFADLSQDPVVWKP